MKARDVLIRVPENIKRSSGLVTVVRAMKRSELAVIPVVDADSRLQGVVRLEDVTRIFNPYPGQLARLIRTLPFLDDFVERDFPLEDFDEEACKLGVAEDFMTTDFMAVPEDMDLDGIYNEMRVRGTDIACVVNEGVLAGMVRLVDIVTAVFKEKGLI